MKTSFNKLIVLCIIFLFSNSVITAQTLPAKNKSEGEICSKTIKYSAEKILGPNGEDIAALTEVTINPTTKVITLESAPPDQEKVLFETQIESIQCAFGKKLNSGKAYYKGYILQQDGNKSPVEIVLEAKDGAVTLTSYDEDKKVGLMVKFNKWVIIDN